GRRLAAFGCAAVGIVVLYSLTLLGDLDVPPLRPGAKSLATAEREAQQLDERFRKHAVFIELVERQADAVAARRRPLREAGAAVRASGGGQDPACLDVFRDGVGAESDEQCVAALITRYTLVRLLRNRSAEGQRRAEEMLATYRADHGAALLAYLLEELELAAGPNTAAPHSPPPSEGAPRWRPRPGAKSPPGGWWPPRPFR